MKNYKLLWGIIVVILFVVVFLSVGIGFLSTQLNNSRQFLSSVEEDVATITEELETTIQMNEDTISDLDACRSQLSISENKVQSTEQELLDLTQTTKNSIADLEKQLESSKEQLASRMRELGGLKVIEDKYNQLICDTDLIDQFNMDYSSIQSSSSRLQGFVANLSNVDHISYAIRNTLWNNADSKIHGIRYVADDGETYSTQFLVYVNELGMKQGTFYIDDQCWLDVP